MSTDVYMITFGVVFCCLLLLPLVCKLSQQAGLCWCLVRDKSQTSIQDEAATCRAQRPVAGSTVESGLESRGIASRPGSLPHTGGAGSSQAAPEQVPRRCAQQLSPTAPPPPPYTVACHLVQPGPEDLPLGDRSCGTPREGRKKRQHKPAKASAKPLTFTTTTSTTTTATTTVGEVRENLSPTPLQSRLRLLRLPYHASPPPVYQEREPSTVAGPAACPEIARHHQLSNGPSLTPAPPVRARSVADHEVSTRPKSRSLKCDPEDLVSGSIHSPASSTGAGNTSNVEHASPCQGAAVFPSQQSVSLRESFSSNACVTGHDPEESAAKANARYGQIKSCVDVDCVGETMTEAFDATDRINQIQVARTPSPPTTGAKMAGKSHVTQPTPVLLQSLSSSPTEATKDVASPDESLIIRKPYEKASALREAEVSSVEARTVRTPSISPALLEGSSSPHRHRGTAKDRAEKVRNHDFAHLLRCGSVRKKMMLFQHPQLERSVTNLE